MVLSGKLQANRSKTPGPQENSQKNLESSQKLLENLWKILTRLWENQRNFLNCDGMVTESYFQTTGKL